MQQVIVRSKRNGCFSVRTNHWGHYMAPCDDPDATPEFTVADANDFHVPDDLVRIPADLWQRWVQLAFHFAPKTDTRSLEVGVRILVNDAGDKYRILVPKQSVSRGSVHATDFDNSIDIETGEVVETWWPAGWNPCGSSHSHGSMNAFFSSVDDSNELGDPGIHITVGGIRPANGMNYELVASVTANKRRFKIPYAKLVDTDPIEEVTFHPKVLEWVKAERPPATSIPGLSGTDYGTNWAGGTTYGRQWQQGRRLGFHGIDDDGFGPLALPAGADRGGQDAWLPKDRRSKRRSPSTRSVFSLGSSLYQIPLEELINVVNARLSIILDVPNQAVDILDRQMEDPMQSIAQLKTLSDQAEDLLILAAIDDILDEEQGELVDTTGTPVTAQTKSIEWSDGEDHL
jgi:hypothetical protein